MPKWWRPSLPLNVSEAEAERIAAKLVDAVQHAPEKEEPSESPSKRVKIHHCAEVKDWFLDLVAINFGSAAFGEQGAREVGVLGLYPTSVAQPADIGVMKPFKDALEAIPEDGQPTRPLLTRAQRLLAVAE